MTLASVRRPTSAARSAAWKASPITYTPPWKYRTMWRGSIPAVVIFAGGTPPRAGAGPGAARGRRRERPEQPPLLADGAVEREGGMSQDRVEVVSLFGAHGDLPSVGIRP